MRYYLLLLILTAYSLLVSAQVSRTNLDSLLNEIKKSHSDTDRIKINYTIAENYSSIYPDSGVLFGNIALKEAKKIKWVEGEITSLTTLSHVYIKMGNLNKALEIGFEALDRYKTLKENELLLSKIYSTLGMIYLYLNDNNKALKYYQDDLKISLKYGKESELSSTYNSIGIIYMQMEKFQEALKYYSIAMQKSLASKNETIYAYAASNSGSIYQSLNENEKALEFHFKALNIERRLNDIYGMATEYASIGKAYHAIYLNSKKTKYLDSAIEYLILSIDYCYRCQNMTDLVIIEKLLSQVYKDKGEYFKSLEALENSIRIQDTLYSAENSSELRAIEEKQINKLNDIKLAKEKQIRNLSIGGFVFMLAFAIIFFYQRNKIHKEKKRSEELLLNILPESVAEELKKTGKADAKSIESATILFTDFKGFTSISELLTPTELVTEIDTYFRAFDHIISKYSIEKIKTIGDAYMCVGGLPTPNTTHPVDVVNAALEIRDWVETHKQIRRENNQNYFEIRIGIHTGHIVAGIVGIKKFAYDVWGDAVNTAARMESSGEVGKVNISQSTYELIKDKFHCSYRGKLEAKNKGEIDMYYVEKIT